MLTETLPTKMSALHPDWPQARFNISGMFAHEPLIVRYLEVVEKDLGVRAPIEAVHGAPPVPWNGGRLARVAFNRERFAAHLEFLHSKGVGYFPTFTNRFVTKEELGDPACNYILECISRRADLNGVIVVSDLLSEYIAERYPRLRQVASVIKVTMEHGEGRGEYYSGLGERFERYVVDPDDGRDVGLLEQLDRAKAEILVNENCVADCPKRARHYDAHARLQRAATPAERQLAQREVDDICRTCGSLLNLNRMGCGERSCNLSRGELREIYQMGFRHFKLQGRADDPFTYAYDLVRFTLEPEFAAPRIFKVLSTWMCTVAVPC